MQKTRQVRKASKLLKDSQDFFIKELGKQYYLHTPHYLEDSETWEAILHVATYRDVQKLKKVFYMFDGIDGFLTVKKESKDEHKI